MRWAQVLYDWGGWNVALFQWINQGTPVYLEPLVEFFSLIGSYWTAPLTLIGLWSWSRWSADETWADRIRRQTLRFAVAFLIALLATALLKWLFDFPRPPAVLGALVRVMGVPEYHYSTPSGHATYAALLSGVLWPLLSKRWRVGLLVYLAMVGWSRIAAGMHFPADVLAGWGLGLGCVAFVGMASRRVNGLRVSLPPVSPAGCFSSPDGCTAIKAQGDHLKCKI